MLTLNRLGFLQVHINAVSAACKISPSSAEIVFLIIMFGFIQHLIGKFQKSRYEELPLEMPTTIAYPDGTRRTDYRAEFKDTLGSEVRAMIAELKAAHPAVATRLALVWGTPEYDEYMNSLLFDERAVDKEHSYRARAGFSPDVMSLLMRLHEEHQIRFNRSPQIS